MRDKESLQSFKIGATFLGTIVGAGFASGQEILQFFTIYRFDGYIGIAIAIILFWILGIIILNIAHVIKRKSYHDFLVYVCGRKLGAIFDVILTIFLFGTLNVMLSATGALFSEHFGLPYYFGIIFTIIPLCFVAIRGLNGVMNVNSIIAPAMVLIVIVVSSLCIYYHATGDLIRNLHYEDDNTFKWLMSAILYVSYNMILSIPVLVPIGKEIDKKVFVKGITIGTLFMGLLILLLNTVILNHIEQDSLYQIPMLYIVQPFSDLLRYCFIIVLWLEIFTTLVSNLFGLATRVQAATKIDYKKIVVIICILGMFISRLDFRTLLTIFYPTFGFIALLFIIILLLKEIYLKIRRFNRKKL